MADNKKEISKIPFIKTVAGMSAVTYIALLILFIISIAIVTTEMMNITNTSISTSKTVEGVMEDVRVFEVDMRILDNDGFALASMYDTIVSLGQLETKVPEMQQCLTEMDEAVSGLETTFASITESGSNAQKALSTLKENYSGYKTGYTSVISAAQSGDVNTILGVVYGDASTQLANMKEQLEILNQELVSIEEEAHNRVPCSSC